MNKMIDGLKKTFAVIGVAALLVSMAPSAAFAVARNPKDPNSREVILPAYLGAKACRVAGSTTASLCSTAGSSGMLYELCAFGTAAVVGKGAMAFDTASTAGLTSFDVADSFVGAYAISPVVIGTAYINSGVAVTPDAVGGCWRPAMPMRYESGFVMRLNDASLMGIAIVRPDTGVNP